MFIYLCVHKCVSNEQSFTFRLPHGHVIPFDDCVFFSRAVVAVQYVIALYYYDL